METEDFPEQRSTALEMKAVTKSYGDLAVLQGLDMNVREGEIYGFLGRNGAGKSTALRIIMGVTYASSGDLYLYQQQVRKNDPIPRQQIGYVAQEQHFYGWMTPTRLGKFVSGFYPKWDKNQYSSLLKKLEVPEERKIEGFSGGMNAKLALAVALASNPRLLLLDEPTAGMDAVARREFLDIVRDDAVRSHRTTLFSSHLIDEVELAADKLGILDRGVMRFEGRLSTLRNSVHRYVKQGATEDDLFDISIDGIDVLQDVQRDGRREITLQQSQASSSFNWPDAMASESGWQVDPPGLEEIFVAMVGRPVIL